MTVGEDFGIADPVKMMAQINAIVDTRLDKPDMGSDPIKLAIAGDWHGNAGWARHAIEYATLKGADAMIQVGDFGFWTKGGDTEAYLASVSKAVRKSGIRFYWFDGNHEDFSRRDEFNSWDTLTYLPRGTRWEWWGKKFMAVGGAFSIDRFLRKEGKGWWPQELLTPEELDYACREPQGLDVILSHDCPTGVNIPGIGPDSKPRGGADIWPPDMLAGAAAHRKKMRQIWDAHHPEVWVHGHFHVPYGPLYYGSTKFYGLDCDGARGGMEKNVMFLTMADLK